MNQKFRNVTLADTLNDDATLLGVQNNGAGVPDDYRFTVGMIVDAVVENIAQLLSKPITASAGSTLTDAFLATAIRYITISGQTYPIGDNTFSQDTGTQTIDFSPLGAAEDGDKIIAWR